MGGALCSSMGKCDDSELTPVTFMEKEYKIDPETGRDKRFMDQFLKKKRMDIMGTAMNQAIDDFKFYMGARMNKYQDLSDDENRSYISYRGDSDKNEY